MALLIGIDEYVAVGDLHGCGNDVERFKSVLIGKFGFQPANIVTLKDAQATRAGILSAFDDLTRRAQSGDVVVVQYSGHGSRVQDVSSDEDDGWDETLVPHDSRRAGVFDITDDELNEVLGRLTAKTANVTLVLDSCHSGSATRGGVDVRRAPDDYRRPAPPPVRMSRVAEGTGDFRQQDATYVLMTGSRPNELSNEFDVDGVRQGALTHFLTQALLAAPKGATYRSIMETVAAKVTAVFPSQHPQLEGLGDRALFGMTQFIALPYVLINPKGADTVVEAGTVLGLGGGSEIDVFPPGTIEFTSKPVARIRIKSGPSALQSNAEVLSGGPIAAASRGVIRTRTYQDSKLRVYLAPPDTAVLGSIRARLGALAGIDIVSDERRADLRLRHERNLLFTESPDLVQLSPPFAADMPDTVDRMVDRVSTWMRWHAIMRLENPDNLLPVSIKLGDGSRTRFTSGDKVDLTVTNLSSEQAFLTLLDLEVDGAVSSLSRSLDRTDPIPPFGMRTRTLQLATPATRVFVPDVFKAILTTSPLDPGLFTQAAARSIDPPLQHANALARFIAQTASGQSRAATVVESVSWGAASVRVETWQPQRTDASQHMGLRQAARLDGFVLHLTVGSRATPASLATRGLPPCPSGATPSEECWTMTPMGPSSAAVQLRPGGPSAGSRAPLSLGAAWDEAERLRVQTGAEVVEPVFEITLDDQPANTPARSVGTVQDKPAAQADTEWSLKHVNAFAARAQLRTILKTPAEAEATGIIVAHPDTGYREHPEFWSSNTAKSPVMFDSGWNFVEENNRPIDPLINAGLLPNPGHGTSSGSVIVSVPGKQWGGGNANEYVTGVAPGARLVPLRVHTSVAHFNPSRLAQAINYAVEPDGVKVRLPAGRRVSVISISMGGLPSLSLYRAVAHAKKTGVILVAAAGNQVQTVVWPARFDDAIAVAATNVECGTWPASSHGGAVDVSAPGESVWHAGVAADGALNAVMGQGTTYAAATTAGVAALWVARHRGTPLFDKLKHEGRLTDAFRDAVQRTSWRPDGMGSSAPPTGVTCASTATWNASEFGVGIIDADRLLREALREPPGSRALPTEPAYPLFESLFDADVPSRTVSERFTNLFPRASPATLKALDGELATLYALDADVRGAVDPLTTPTAPPDVAYAALRTLLQKKDISTAMATAVRVGQ